MARLGLLEIDWSDAIINELIGVLRDDFRWDGYRLHFLRARLAEITRRTVPERRIEAVAADADDNMILECAVAGGSSAIITEDKHLLRLGEFEGIRILRAAAFLAELP